MPARWIKLIIRRVASSRVHVIFYFNILKVIYVPEMSTLGLELDRIEGNVSLLASRGFSYFFP